MLINPSPAVDEVLKSVGLIKPTSKGDGNALREILDNKFLSLENVIEELSNLVHSGKEEIKQRGIDTALKLHKVLEDPETNKIPSITIVIQARVGKEDPIPAILIPRSLDEVLE